MILTYLQHGTPSLFAFSLHRLDADSGRVLGTTHRGLQVGRYKGKYEIQEKEHILTASLVTYPSITIYDPQNTRVMTMATTIRRGSERIRCTTEGSGRDAMTFAVRRSLPIAGTVHVIGVYLWRRISKPIRDCLFPPASDELSPVN
jgi:hypothetical protein